MPTMTLTDNERNFLDEGGALWTVRRAAGGWKVVKLSTVAETALTQVQESEYQAVRLAFLLTDLAPPGARVATHHAIARPIGVPVPPCPRRPVQHANPFARYA